MELRALQCCYMTYISPLVDSPTLLDPSFTSTHMPGTPRSGFSEFAQFIDL